MYLYWVSYLFLGFHTLSWNTGIAEPLHSYYYVWTTLSVSFFYLITELRFLAVLLWKFLRSVSISENKETLCSLQSLLGIWEELLPKNFVHTSCDDIESRSPLLNWFWLNWLENKTDLANSFIYNTTIHFFKFKLDEY